ncbi:hypothetical protein Btru_070767 [Bulinus truncatus]|nr:hypothetical protein Btru_070767 [Bulinus truncatus]
MSFKPEEQLKDFPCTFNLVTSGKVSHSRFQHVKNNVENEFQSQHGNDEEKIRDKNLLTWVFFNLNEKTKASALNKEVLDMSKRKNITALGNLIFLCCRKGNKVQAIQHFEELQNMRSLEDFDQLKMDAMAEQAYCYTRLGGVENYYLCIELFTKCTEKCPENFSGNLALVLPTEDLPIIISYAQLVQLRQHNIDPNQSVIFKNKDIMELVDLALRYGNKDSWVLTLCGKSIKAKDINKSIDLLRKSINIKEDGVAYHHLGISLLKKSDLIASGRYHEKALVKVTRALSYGPEMQEDQKTSKNKNKSGTSAQHGDTHREMDTLKSGYFSVSGNSESNSAGFSQREHSSHYQENTIPTACPIEGSGFKSFQRVPSNFPINVTKDKCWLSEPFTRPEKYISQQSRPGSQQSVSYSNDSRSGRRNYNHSKQSRPGIRKSLSYSNESHSGRRNYSQSGQEFQRTSLQPSLSKCNSSSRNLSALENFAKSSTKKLDIDNELVKEAISCFEKSLTVTHDENIPARLNLADVYLRSDNFQEALTQYNLIIENEDKGYLVSIIIAHENSGKCLKKLSELDNSRYSECFRQEAKKHFIKALSMAVDLASLIPDFKTCETQVWDSFRQLQEDVKKIASPKERRKELLKLLELAKNEDIAKVIKEMLDNGLELDDIDIFLTGLKSFLAKGDYNEALAFLNMASTKSSLTESESWSSVKVMDARSSTYICTAWSRLMKDSPDSRRVFQQMFQLKFGQCAGMKSPGEDKVESEKEKHDVLVVNDESADTEEGPDDSTTLACNLCQVFKVTFGLDTSRNLENCTNYDLMKEEGQLQEMQKYHLVLLILGENDSRAYNQMLQAVHNLNGPNIIVICIRPSQACPEILKMHKFLNIKDAHWQQTKLLADSSEGVEGERYKSSLLKMSRNSVLEKLFDGNKEAVMRLFSFLVDQNFEKHKEHFKPPTIRTFTCLV